MTAVAALVRCSTEKQDVESQRLAIETWAAARGVELAWYDEGADVSGAAAIESRPTLAMLLDDASVGAVKQLVVTEVSRVGRAPPETMERFLTLRRLGVEVYVLDRSPDEPLRFETSKDFIVFAIDVFLAGAEREKCIDRTKRGMALAKVRGAKVGSPAILWTPEQDSLLLAWRLAGKSCAWIAANGGLAVDRERGIDEDGRVATDTGKEAVRRERVAAPPSVSAIRDRLRTLTREPTKEGTS